MVMLHEADIVARTLINVLDPSQEQRSVCLRAQRTRYRRDASGCVNGRRTMRVRAPSRLPG